MNIPTKVGHFMIIMPKFGASGLELCLTKQQRNWGSKMYNKKSYKI